jgi:uroporphyrinogen-III decarboxylase
VDEFMVPYYWRCIAAAKRAGARLFNVDSDGDCNAILDSFVQAGVNMFHPCEPAAFMDMVELRKRYGHKLAFEGGIDKYALLKTKADIDAELEYRVPDMVKTGGCVLGLDHRIPNGVPLENYRYYMARLQELIGKLNY